MTHMTLRDLFRAELRTAMRSRDRATVATLRSTLAAIDNAEAVPVEAQVAGAIEDAPVGPGSAEAERRTLSEDDIRAVVRAEVTEQRAAAETLRARGEQRADSLDHQADLLDGLLAR